MQRTTKIDLRTDQAAYPSVGYIGENNKRTLQIIPPNDLKGADYFMLAFNLDGGVFRPPLHLVPPIAVALGVQVTAQAQVPMTLEAYLNDGTVLGKSHMVILHFDPAVTGEAWDLTGPPGPGIPAGGTAGQLLAKESDADNDTKWIDPPADTNTLPYRAAFTAQDWQKIGANEYQLTIPLETHGKDPLAFVSASNLEQGQGDLENALFGIRRTPRGDIIITSVAPVSGEIFIQKGDN